MSASTPVNIADFPRYRSHKVVGAIRIKSVEPNPAAHGALSLGFEDGRTMIYDTQGRPTPEAGWYFVVYDNGYYSASPAEQFEEGYMPLSQVAPSSAVPMRHGLTFSQALSACIAGALIRRLGWNGKGMFLYYVPGSTFHVNRKPLLGIFAEGAPMKYHAHIDMKTATGECVPWLCSLTDMLATDWEIIEPTEDTLAEGDKVRFSPTSGNSTEETYTISSVQQLDRDHQTFYSLKEIKGIFTRASLVRALMLLLMLALAGVAHGQQPKPAPGLDNTTKIALEAILREQQDIGTEQSKVDARRQSNLQRLRAVESDLAARYPGFHLDEQTGSMVADPKPAPAPAPAAHIPAPAPPATPAGHK